ncbi:MAG: DNA mismatch repair protein MutH [Tissierellia bacterium]|nr:DNA mismatch repair protein MutH [Tissierellia bacterium]
MKLNDAKRRLDSIVNVPLREWMNQDQLQGITINKGKAGQLLEIALGLNNTSNKLDFEDGELKTNKCNKFGKPLETMFITQILSIIDELLSNKNFYNTRLYEKIDNLLYVPISKDGSPEDWFFLPYEHVNLNDNYYYDLKIQLEYDYYSICQQLHEHIEHSYDGYIHTSNGEFIQIRSKDSKPYNPIFSNVYDKYVSNKNHAFYFKKAFMQYITNR